MQNPLSLLTSLNGNAAQNGAKPAASQPSGAPFNQFLSREMANRPAPAQGPMPTQGNGKIPATVQQVNAQRAPAVQKQAQAQPQQQTQQAGAKQADGQAQGNAAQADAGQAAEPVAAKADAAEAPADAPVAQAGSAERAESDAEDAADVPVDLLALVASFNQPATPADKPQAQAEDATAVAIDTSAGAQRAAEPAAATQGAAQVAADAADAADAAAAAGPADAEQDFAAALASLTGKAKDAAPAQSDAAQAAAPVEAKDVPVAAVAADAAPAEVKPAPDRTALPATSMADEQDAKPADAAIVADAKPAARSERPAGARADTNNQPAQQAAARDAAPNPALAAAQAGAERQPSGTVTQANTPQLSEISAATAAGAQSAPVQQAAFTVAQAAGDPAADKLSPPVGTPAWEQAVGQKVVWMVAGGQQSATLTLNPPDLGPLQVVVNVTNDQASADFSSNSPEVREALESAMPKLRDMMSDAGIQLGSSTVGTGMPNQQMAQDQQNQPRAPRMADGSPRPDAGNDADGVRAPAPRPQRAAVGLVDTFV